MSALKSLALAPRMHVVYASEVIVTRIIQGSVVICPSEALALARTYFKDQGSFPDDANTVHEDILVLIVAIEVKTRLAKAIEDRQKHRRTRAP